MSEVAPRSIDLTFVLGCIRAADEWAQAAATNAEGCITATERARALDAAARRRTVVGHGAPRARALAAATRSADELPWWLVDYLRQVAAADGLEALPDSPQAFYDAACRWSGFAPDPELDVGLLGGIADMLAAVVALDDVGHNLFRVALGRLTVEPTPVAVAHPPDVPPTLDVVALPVLAHAPPSRSRYVSTIHVEALAA